MNNLNFPVHSVINWYQNFGRKKLPWQIEKNLYKVWLSEIMLQQTRVITVIPYFKKFITRFPNIKILSESSLSEVMKLWSGLGYYNRAKNLHKAAKMIVEQYKGIFPTNFKKLVSLPGIGRSTAGAILSLTLDKRYPILDGNIKRVLTRYYLFIEQKKKEKKMWKVIESILPNKNISQFNQAMMDIGAMICTYSKPKCDLCPINLYCKTKNK